MNERKYSTEGLGMTKAFEGLRLTAYQDSTGIWTIGYGHSGPDVHSGMVITEAEAATLLLSDLAEAIRCVNEALTVEVDQRQFDAMVDFAFNCGRANFLNSTLLRKLNAGDVTGAAQQFPLWVHAGGSIIPGLVRRRKAEAALFVGGTPCPIP